MRFVLIVACLLGADPVRAATEPTIQTALETVPGGSELAGVADDGTTPIRVRPLRTWKSQSGHFCRSYQLDVSGAQPRRERSKRCRETGGGWGIPR